MACSYGRSYCRLPAAFKRPAELFQFGGAPPADLRLRTPAIARLFARSVLPLRDDPLAPYASRGGTEADFWTFSESCHRADGGTFEGGGAYRARSSGSDHVETD